MKKRIVLNLLYVFGLMTILMLTSCTLTNHIPDNNNGGRTLKDFDFLELGMSYEEIKARVGPYDQDVGFGIHILAYELSDGSVLLLGFSFLDHLDYVKLLTPDGNKQDILPPSDNTPSPTP
ncbi:hypothetical protein ACFLYP_00540 [Chloroflexota bacterium]